MSVSRKRTPPKIETVEESQFERKDTNSQSCHSPLQVDKKPKSQITKEIVSKLNEVVKSVAENGKKESKLERSRYSKRERRRPTRFDELDRKREDAKTTERSGSCNSTPKKPVLSEKEQIEKEIELMRKFSESHNRQPN